MRTSLLKSSLIILVLAACTSTSKNMKAPVADTPVFQDSLQPQIAGDVKPASLMDLPQSQYGGFVLKPGFYEAEFKTYCLQAGTPDPSPTDAYYLGSVSGYRKEIVQDILLNSREHPGMNQKNVQLLLWSVVSGTSFSKLSSAVQNDARQLLTSKQIFELNGGVVGLVRTVSQTTGILNANRDMQRLFEVGTSSYEAYERLAVRREQSKIVRSGVRYDRWYKQKENYYVRYYPVNYQKVRVQVYVPDGLLDSEGKLDGDFVLFDPTGMQAIPAYTNAQRLGVGGPLLDVVRVIIRVNKKPESRVPDVKRPPRDPKRDPKRDPAGQQLTATY